MEDKRGTKHSHSPSKEGSSSPSGGLTPPSVLSGSPPPLGSPSEISSCRPCSPVFEQGGTSKKAPVVDLSSSSDVEGLIPDTSHDEEFTRRIFGDINCDVLRLLSDGNIIILSDSNEEEEVREEDVVDAKVAPSSATSSRPHLPSSLTPMKIPRGCKTIIVMVLPLIGKEAMAATTETRLVHLRLPRQGGACREACFKEN
jgi:hypothetical protein